MKKKSRWVFVRNGKVIGETKFTAGRGWWWAPTGEGRVGGFHKTPQGAVVGLGSGELVETERSKSEQRT